MKSHSTRYNKQVKTVDEYIQSFPKDVALKLQKIRETVLQIAKGADETLSYHMPAYTFNSKLLYFAAFEYHIGFYPFPSAVKEFKKELILYKTAKGSIQFPLDKSLPLALIRKIVKFRVKENIEKQKITKSTSKKLKVCSRGHEFDKSTYPVCPKCWPGYYKK